MSNERIEGMLTYSVAVWCANCRSVALLAIPEGTLVSRALNFIPCSECGCMTLERDDA